MTVHSMAPYDKNKVRIAQYMHYRPPINAKIDTIYKKKGIIDAKVNKVQIIATLQHQTQRAPSSATHPTTYVSDP